MTSLLLVLLTSTQTPSLHLVTRASCEVDAGLRRALEQRQPSLRVAADELRAGDDRVATLRETSSGYALELWTVGGERVLHRNLPATCETVAELAAAVLERHFSEVSWPPNAPNVSLPEEEAQPEAEVIALPPPAPVTPPSRWSGAVVLAMGVGGDAEVGVAPLGLLDARADYRALQLGLLGGITAPNLGEVEVDDNRRGELSSRVDLAVAHGSGCVDLFSVARACAGPMAGALLLTGSADGRLYQREATTLVAPAVGGSLSAHWLASANWTVSLRAGALHPLRDVSVSVEGTDVQRSLSTQAFVSLGFGWSTKK